MSRRHEQIAEAFDHTFQWILQGDQDDVNTTEGAQVNDLVSLQRATRTNFISWLRSGSGIFWIDGKAGSGKSTLMKLIFHSPETRVHLRHWSGSCDLFVGHFHFFDRGSSLEKSQEGLIRHLLYQIFERYPHLMNEVYKSHWDRLRGAGRAYLRTDPTAKYLYEAILTRSELVAALQAVLFSTIGKVRICFLIDGLDEFNGTDREVLELMAQLESMYAKSATWHKICVSSRPHIAFEAAFRKRPSLRMQDLTKNDIYHYVNSRLRSQDLPIDHLAPEDLVRFETLVDDIVEKARGVFLWVHLAVMSLLHGLDQSDWMHELEARVRGLPPELDTFYDRMVNLIDPGYRYQAARIFRIMLDSPDPPHPLILSFLENNNDDIDRHPREAFSYKALNARGKHMEQRLRSRFWGLIEISRQTTSIADWSKSTTADWTKFNALFFHQTVRDYFKRPEPWKMMLDGMTVSWCSME
ncbi:hypothetical protein LTR84_007479 [Exophiala bonariae]|uniref:NACHT domain-containing protein n=1 Tax=Exophiala bonariae TaxID=1690606 RepID=A0AAV9N133_9EURO|nr:hypothetical protein LTR84_007479 [Exophiala bonariae]